MYNKKPHPTYFKLTCFKFTNVLKFISDQPIIDSYLGLPRVYQIYQGQVSEPHLAKVNLIYPKLGAVHL